MSHASPLERQMHSVANFFHSHIPQAQVSEVLSSIGVGVFNPYYDTCNRFHMELMMSGVASVCGPHIIYDERPVVRFDGTVSGCLEGIARITNGFQDVPDAAMSEQARDFAFQSFSNKASLAQLNSILRGLL